MTFYIIYILKLAVLLLPFSYHIKENCPLYPMLKLCGPLLFFFFFFWVKRKFNSKSTLGNIPSIII